MLTRATQDAIAQARRMVERGEVEIATDVDGLAMHLAEAIVELERDRPNRVDEQRLDRGDYIRAGGGACCTIVGLDGVKCGVELRDHPRVAGYDGVVRRCDGRLCKL